MMASQYLCSLGAILVTDPQLLEKMLEKNVVIPLEAGEMSENVRKCSVFAAGGPPWGAPPSVFLAFPTPSGRG